MANKRVAKCKPLDDDIRKIENIFLVGESYSMSPLCAKFKCYVVEYFYTKIMSF